MVGESYMKRITITILILALLTGCSDDMPDFDVPAAANAVSILEPVDTTLVLDSYDGEEARSEETIKSYASKDGLCVIEKKPSYYEVWLHHDKAEPYEVGRAYAETIKELDVDYAGILEPYLYENIKNAFPNLDDDYTPVTDRINELVKQIPEAYLQEIKGLAESLSDGERGMEDNGKMSYEEALLAQMVPDCVRGTNCSALAVWGEKSATGGMLISRTLDWLQGSEYQMCTAQAVTHFVMGEGKNSYTTFAVLGMLDTLTGLNDKDVFAGMLDAGCGHDYICEGKKCYSFELRYALENMSDARSIGEYMVSESKNFTYSHNIFVADKNNCYVAEDCVDTGEDNEGLSMLRDKDTKLFDGISWDNPDSLCVVNAFQSEGMEDALTASGGNLVRFTKYNTWVAEKDKLTAADIKSIVTRESIERAPVFQGIYSYLTYHVIVYDYAAGNLDISFTGTEGSTDHPVFTRVAH